MERACRGSPWTIADQHLIVTGWVPNFDPTTAFIAQVLVWVMLPGLPLEYWDDHLLQMILEPLGTVLRLDEVTRSRGRANKRAMFARVLIKMDISHEPLEGVCIRTPEGERFQKFTIENPPSQCANCRSFIIQQGCLFCHSPSQDKGKTPVEDDGTSALLPVGSRTSEAREGPWTTKFAKGTPRRNPQPKNGGCSTTVGSRDTKVTIGSTITLHNPFSVLQLESVETLTEIAIRQEAQGD